MKPMSFSFNFPAIHTSKAAAEDLQKKLHEELEEVDEAYFEVHKLQNRLEVWQWLDEDGYAVPMETMLDAKAKLASAREHLLEELLDLYHAVETNLRSFDTAEIFEMRNAVIAKNKRRHYYDEENNAWSKN